MNYIYGQKCSKSEKVEGSCQAILWIDSFVSCERSQKYPASDIYVWGKSHVLCVCSPILWIVCHSDPIGVIWGGGVTKRACGRRHTREGPCVQCVPGHTQTAATHPQPQSNRNQVVSSEYCELPDSQLSLGNPIPVTKIVDWLPGMSTFSQPET